MRASLALLLALSGAALFCGCTRTQKPTLTDEEIDLLDDELADGATPEQACQTLEKLCKSTGAGCGAHAVFCDVPTKAYLCQQLAAACVDYKKACDVHERHCKDAGLDAAPDTTSPDASPSDTTADHGSRDDVLRLTYTPVPACRIVNTKESIGSFSADEERHYVVYGDDLSDQGGASGCQLPPGIGTPKAAHINVIALVDEGFEGVGNFRVFPYGDEVLYGTVNFNSDTGQPYIGNALTVMLCNDDDANCEKHVTAKMLYGDSPGLIIDVLGYYTEDTAPTGDADKALVFTPVQPCRIVDTRWGGGGKLSDGDGGHQYFVYGDDARISGQGGSGGCPSPRGEPSAVDLHLTTVVDPEDTDSQGNISIMPGNVLSFVNYKHGLQDTGNSGIVMTNHAGGPDEEDITVISKWGTTHVVIDVLGYYYPNDSSPSNPEGDYLYTPVMRYLLVIWYAMILVIPVLAVR